MIVNHITYKMYKVIIGIIYTTKTDEFVCPTNISETVDVRIMKLAHRPRIASTKIKFSPYVLIRRIELWSAANPNYFHLHYYSTAYIHT